MYESVWTQLGYLAKSIELSPKSYHAPICVTGVDGFIGSWIVAELLNLGYSVRGTIQNRKTDDVSGLACLPFAKEHLTIIEASLLTPESCDLAIHGCAFVIHTGTPSSCAVRDPLSELQEPGVHSIGSRMHCIIPMMTNFIQACARANISKLVYTSSIAAMADACVPPNIITDTSWNRVSTLEKNPHFLSLKMAEEAAWQLVDQLPKESAFEFITINAGTLLGPVLCKSSTSAMPAGNQVVYDLITGKYSALVDLNWAMIDVRDAARAHIAALQNFQAKGRFVCVHKTIWLNEMVNILSENGYRARALPWRVGLPHWVARLPSYSIQLGQVGAALYSRSEADEDVYLNAKLKNILQLTQFTDLQATILDVAADFLKWGQIKPWDEDHQALECVGCSYPFTFYRRKHHCRECGVIICADCSNSRAVVTEDATADKARLCDACVQSSIPGFLTLLQPEAQLPQKLHAVIALESLMENQTNHDFVMRAGGLPLLMDALHELSDPAIASHAAGTLYALSANISSCLQMVLEGAVLQMLEVNEQSMAWRIALQALRNIWRQVNKPDFRKMLFAVSRVSSDAANVALQGNILLTFVHMMDSSEVDNLLDEGLLRVLYMLLTSTELYPRCAAAHAIKHLLPHSFQLPAAMAVPPYIVDDHEDLLTNSSLSDLQFLVKGHIAPINAHKVVLFFRSCFFKNLFGHATNNAGTSTVEITNCSHRVFSQLLFFLYTGRLQIEAEDAQELLRASSYYQVIELQKRVENFLTREITVENVVALLHVAVESRADVLQDNCIAFLMQNIHQVVRLADFVAYRDWAGLEVLGSLATVLGPVWETSLSTVVQQVRAEGPSSDILMMTPPDSPLVHSLRTNPASPKQPLNLIDVSADEEPLSEDLEEEEEDAMSPLIKSRAYPVYSDDFSDRSEGVC